LRYFYLSYFLFQRWFNWHSRSLEGSSR